MIKSFSTFARIHWPVEYEEYLDCKAYRHPSGKKKRLKQVIKADALIGNSEYTFEDWIEDYQNYCEELYWQEIHDCAETLRQ